MNSTNSKTYTALGVIPILVWGTSIAFIRHIRDSLGLFATVGSLYAFVGIIGLLWQLLKKGNVDSAPFYNRYLYLRWFFFVAHTSLLMTAIATVSLAHLPFVIMLNYLWPTCIILSSVCLSAAQVTRTLPFLFGCILVILSLAIEIVGPRGFSRELFVHTHDCWAYLLAFLGAISWGFYSAFSRVGGDASGGSSTVWIFQLTIGLALPLTLVPGFQSGWELPQSDWILFALYCVSQFFAFLCWDLGMRKGNIVILSLLADFIPFLSLLNTHLLLGINISPKTIFAVVLLVCGAIVTRYGTKGKQAVVDVDSA